MKEASLCIIEDQLNHRYAMVKNHRGINAGCVNFPGGKRENGESMLDCACREAFEETGLEIKNPQKVGFVKFHPIEISVHIFKTTEFSGKLKDNSEEVDVFWQDADNVPYDQMRHADRDFIAEVLSGKYVQKCYVYDADFNVVSVHELANESDE